MFQSPSHKKANPNSNSNTGGNGGGAILSQKRVLSPLSLSSKATTVATTDPNYDVENRRNVNVSGVAGSRGNGSGGGLLSSLSSSLSSPLGLLKNKKKSSNQQQSGTVIEDSLTPSRVRLSKRNKTNNHDSTRHHNNNNRSNAVVTAAVNYNKLHERSSNTNNDVSVFPSSSVTTSTITNTITGANKNNNKPDPEGTSSSLEDTATLEPAVATDVPATFDAETTTMMETTEPSTMEVSASGAPIANEITTSTTTTNAPLLASFTDSSGSSSLKENNNDDTASDCGTEISCVSARREWLLTFGKEHQKRTTNNSTVTATNNNEPIRPSLSSSLLRTTNNNNPTRSSGSNGGVAFDDSRDDNDNNNSNNDRSNVGQLVRFSDTSSLRGTRSIPTTPPRRNNNHSGVADYHKQQITTIASTGAPSTPVTFKSSSSSSSHIRNRIGTPHFTAGATVGGVATTRRVVRNYSPKDLRSQRDMKDVQATDEGYASVAKLSQWLASDPTSTKKKKHVRRGKNVISKSRQFEKDLENVIIVENHISRGAVTDKKKWLQTAFGDGHDDTSDVASSVASSRYTKSEVGVGSTNRNMTSTNMTMHRFTSTYQHHQMDSSSSASSSKQNMNFNSAQSEIITDDAASSLSVADKKDWLKNAFKKDADVSSSSASSAAMPPRPYGYSKARTDIMHDRITLGSGGAAAARAKMRFKERSSRKVVQSAILSPTKLPQQPASQHGVSTEAKTNDLNGSFDATVDDSFQEGNTTVDFQAARETLVSRSKKNGHKVDIVNKVYLRKNQFEQMEAESRRTSGAYGLAMKASWDTASPSSGRPSTSYKKTFVAPDIAPKKSFEDLP